MSLMLQHFQGFGKYCENVELQCKKKEEAEDS